MAETCTVPVNPALMSPCPQLVQKGQLVGNTGDGEAGMKKKQCGEVGLSGNIPGKGLRSQPGEARDVRIIFSPEHR
jgi:hypothetical protein